MGRADAMNLQGKTTVSSYILYFVTGASVVKQVFEVIDQSNHL